MTRCEALLLAVHDGRRIAAERRAAADLSATVPLAQREVCVESQQ